VFSKEFLEVFKQVIFSWQVIAVTAVLLIYFKIVSYAAQSYHKPRVKKEKVKKSKPEPVQGPEEAETGGSSNEELGLEED
jgi:hypothetical protein